MLAPNPPSPHQHNIQEFYQKPRPQQSRQHSFIETFMEIVKLFIINPVHGSCKEMIKLFFNFNEIEHPVYFCEIKHPVNFSVFYFFLCC